ncbi:membrane protein insertase YidC [Virgibacillus kekensis]|uniref:Membrane protein insertase YidC n=1 Tax=Virgibacillus kekensis TaxID=202261 RepID=A0ABV9DJF3_9BACI
MEKNTVFTFFKYGALIAIIILTGCGADGESASSTFGWFDHYFVDPFLFLIKLTASLTGENYGLSIIVITLLIRVAIMPFMLKQMRTSRELQKKMKQVKPEMEVIQEKYKEKKDTDSRLQMQQEMQMLYKKHGLNPLASMGCLPMIIQFPILIGFYYAIKDSPEIATHTFLWFNLGQPDWTLTAIAVLVYFIQFKVSQIGMEPQQKKQMSMFGLISPVMIGFVSLTAPAALPLYWTTGGMFLILQTWMSKKP